MRRGSFWTAEWKETWELKSYLVICSKEWPLAKWNVPSTERFSLFWQLTVLMRFAWHVFCSHKFLSQSYCGWYSLCLPLSTSSPSTRHFSRSRWLHGARKPVVQFHPLSSFRYGQCAHTHTHTHTHTRFSPVCLSFPLLFLTRTQLILPRSQHPLHTVQSSWHTSPLTLRQCVSSEPAVITTVDPPLTHDCLGTRTAGPTLVMDGIRQSGIEHTVPHLPLVCLHSAASHVFSSFLSASRATHWFHEW